MYCTIRCCKDCQERQAGCHSLCERYREEKEAWESLRKAEQKEKQKEAAKMCAIVAAKKRMMKGRKK